MGSRETRLDVRDVDDGVRVIDVVGEITAAADDALRDAHERASTEDVRAVVLNFSDLEYMNSGGIGLVVTMLIRAQRAGHRLCAVGLSEHYRELFALTRLDEAITVFDSEAAAIAAGRTTSSQ